VTQSYRILAPKKLTALLDYHAPAVEPGITITAPRVLT
jgi:hypothetical protein